MTPDSGSKRHPLHLIPTLLQPHFATAATVLAASALGLLAEHGRAMARVLARGAAGKMAGEQIARSWPRPPRGRAWAPGGTPQQT